VLTAHRPPTSFGTSLSVVVAALSALTELTGVAAAVELGDGGRAAEHAAGQRAARRSLVSAGEATGLVGRSPAGRPCWPPGFLGSIAHANGIAVAAATATPPLFALGIDIELEAALPASDASWVMSSDETLLLRCGPGQADRLATRLWSAKEAAFKAWCTAVEEDLDGVDPRDIVVRPSPNEVPSFEVEAIGELARGPVGRASRLDGRWWAAGSRFVTLVWR
jgi:4'-phosphopantetheinyl transferase EntD